MSAVIDHPLLRTIRNEDGDLIERIVIEDPVIIPLEHRSETRAEVEAKQAAAFERRPWERFKRWYRRTDRSIANAIHMWVIAHRGLFSRRVRDRYDTALFTGCLPRV